MAEHTRLKSDSGNQVILFNTQSSGDAATIENRRVAAPTNNTERIGVNTVSDTDEPGPNRDVGEVRHPQHVRCRGAGLVGAPGRAIEVPTCR